MPIRTWNCASLTSVYVPAGVTSIVVNSTFCGCPNVVLSVADGSYAMIFAINNNVAYTVRS